MIYRRQYDSRPTTIASYNYWKLHYVLPKLLPPTLRMLEVGNYPKLIKAKLGTGRLAMEMVDCGIQSQQSLLNDENVPGNDSFSDANDFTDADSSAEV